MIPTSFVTNPLLSLFCSFRKKQILESNAPKVGGLLTKNISVFCLKLVALYFKDIPILIDSFKGIFLHVIPVLAVKETTLSTST